MNITSKKLSAIVPRKLASIAVVDGNIDLAIRAYKKLIKDTEVVKDTFERAWFEPKSVTKRRQLDTAKFQQRKRDASNQ